MLHDGVPSTNSQVTVDEPVSVLTALGMLVNSHGREDPFLLLQVSVTCP